MANSPAGGDVGGGFYGGNNLTGAAALEPLADNGGPTPTMKRLDARGVDAGNPNYAPVLDQRRGVRTVSLNVWAYETGIDLHRVVVTTPADEDDGNPAAWASLREALAHTVAHPGADAIALAGTGTLAVQRKLGDMPASTGG